MTAVLSDVIGAHAGPACAGTADDLWWQGGPSSEARRARREALAICSRCPVFARCHAYSEEHKPYGFWAGEFRNLAASRYQVPDVLAYGRAEV